LIRHSPPPSSTDRGARVGGMRAIYRASPTRPLIAIKGARALSR
jgi:hypothetical protein